MKAHIIAKIFHKNRKKNIFLQLTLATKTKRKIFIKKQNSTTPGRWGGEEKT
jgi:hypothetical protein